MGRTVLIVDDHDDFRSIASDLLREEGFDVSGEAADGETALVMAAAGHPDVVLLDIQLPGLSGFEVAVQLAELDPRPEVVLTSSRTARSYAGRLATCPVRGFIPKQDLSGAALTSLLASP